MAEGRILCLLAWLKPVFGFLLQADGASAAGRKSTASRWVHPHLTTPPSQLAATLQACLFRLKGWVVQARPLGWEVSALPWRMYCCGQHFADLLVSSVTGTKGDSILNWPLAAQVGEEGSCSGSHDE